jgi:hypothetical protein
LIFRLECFRVSEEIVVVSRSAGEIKIFLLPVWKGFNSWWIFFWENKNSVTGNELEITFSFLHCGRGNVARNVQRCKYRRSKTCWHRKCARLNNLERKLRWAIAMGVSVIKLKVFRILLGTVTSDKAKSHVYFHLYVNSNFCEFKNLFPLQCKIIERK